MTRFSIAAALGVVATTLALNAAPARAATTYGTGTIALGTTVYTQSFDTLASTGTTGIALPNGWRALEDGASANGTYGVGNGSLNTGNVYSFGATGSTDRALGTLRSGNLLPAIGAIFTNATGSKITDLVIAYTGEQWRDGGSPVDSLNFQYSLTSTNFADALTSAAWTSVSALNFLSPTNSSNGGALDGNAAANSRALSATLSKLAIGSGATFAFRWIDADPAGADDGLAIDTFRVRATTAVVAAVPEPATWAMMIAGFALIGFAVRRGTAARWRGAVAA
ncbi:PEPxxWA-CTERM sorting domain-containing protein [Sphingomonas sp. PAMC 26621]|uniref:PEPxxWA-CTERM sorting domain-containing protein n=1 Tax=Sphingomonas sp. PAMC 26621 TaxID=1112213 RepID=UPI000287E58D|nr:PEPxxWA-CTERM sorting domain-containing protein [Sphingomonas sp. PAMC 26621]